jgi:hypothetical protein
MAGVSKTVVKRTKDVALEHVRWALREGANPLTKPEVSFVRTSCHILGIDSATTMKAIVRKAKDKGKRQPRKVLEQLQSQLKELAEGVDKHKRPTPNIATWAWTPWGRRRAAWGTCRAARTR